MLLFPMLITPPKALRVPLKLSTERKMAGVGPVHLIRAGPIVPGGYLDVNPAAAPHEPHIGFSIFWRQRGLRAMMKGPSFNSQRLARA